MSDERDQPELPDRYRGEQLELPLADAGCFVPLFEGDDGSFAAFMEAAAQGGPQWR